MIRKDKTLIHKSIFVFIEQTYSPGSVTQHFEFFWTLLKMTCLIPGLFNFFHLLNLLFLCAFSSIPSSFDRLPPSVSPFSCIKSLVLLFIQMSVFPCSVISLPVLFIELWLINPSNAACKECSLPLNLDTTFVFIVLCL